MHRYEQCVDISRGHMVIPAGTVDPLQVKHIEFVAVGLYDFLQISFFEQLIFYRPDIRKIILVQRHAVIKKERCIFFPDLRQWGVIFRTFQTVYKFFNCSCLGQLIQIKFGMPVKEIFEQR